MKKILTFAITLVFLVLCVTAASASMQVLPKKKTTDLNLYVTAKEAYKQWKAAPDKIKIIDVRTPGEYIYVGHAPMALNIPIKLLDTGNYSEKMKPTMKINENFVAEVMKKCEKNDTIFIICRSGSRSAVSTNLLAKAGFTNVYNVIDGFEGDKLKAPGTEGNGKRLVNGWKNAGAPWTYKLKADLVYLPQT